MLSQGLDAFTAYILQSLPVHPPTYDDIRRINTGLLQVDEAKGQRTGAGKESVRAFARRYRAATGCVEEQIGVFRLNPIA